MLNYEGMLESIYRSALRPGDTALDIGAHIGRHALPMAQAIGPQGKLFAFEPLPDAYAKLLQAAQSLRNEGKEINLSTHNIALGEEEGSAEFIYVPDFPEYSGFQERTYHTDSLRTEKIQVEVRRLDSLFNQLDALHFIKVDAEGGELAILRGGKALIAKHLPIVSFELGNASLVNYPYTAADYYGFFAELGYTLFSIFGISLTREQFIDAAEEQFFWDYIAIPQGKQWPFLHEPAHILAAQLNEVQYAKEHATAQLNEVQYAKEHATAQVEKLGSETKVLLSRAEAAESKVSRMQATRSWRYTAPFRSLYKVFKKK